MSKQETEEVRYAVYCQHCGYLEDKAWDAAKENTHAKRSERPLSPRDQAPTHCQKCGSRKWEVPASKAHIEEYETRLYREQRALELCAKEDFDGLFKIPEEIKAAPEIKKALSNLLGPLEGEVLKTAQRNILTVARSGYQLDAMGWIDYYDRAIAKAVASVKTAKTAA